MNLNNKLVINLRFRDPRCFDCQVLHLAGAQGPAFVRGSDLIDADLVEIRPKDS
jgi:hypothetical protein